MAANTSISLVSLDFDTIKNNLKTHLTSQAIFADYDFEGSNMSVLLDILAYNTHLNAFYLNMVASEAFLDSAQLRNSVVSKAKELNYITKSVRSSTAIIKMEFKSSIDSPMVVIPEKTRFSADNANGSYTFTTNMDRILYPNGGVFSVDNLSIYEGSYLSDTFAMDYSIENQRFLLTNATIDTESITVIAIENFNSTPIIFKRANDLYGLTPSSNVFFIQSAEDSKYEVVFGDGIFGRKPLNAAILQITYRISSGADGNGAAGFTLDDNLQIKDNTITLISAPSGGAAAESIESIKFNAPRHYQTQNRAVTANDYKTLVLNQYPDIKNVHVYGGETVTGTVQFGKTFVVPITKNGHSLANFQKNDIQAFLSDKCTVGINPIVINPNYLYLLINAHVTYNTHSTDSSLETIQTVVSEAIKNFNTTSLTDFNTTFKFSRLETAINDSDPSISSNQLIIMMRKNISVDLNSPLYPSVSFSNSVVPGSIYSSTFLSNGRQYQYTDYNPNNNTIKVTQSSTGSVVLTNSTNIIYLKDVTIPGSITYIGAGTIDYSKGEIVLNKITVTSLLTAGKLSISATPVHLDIDAKQNDVILIDEKAGIKVTVVAA